MKLKILKISFENFNISKFIYSDYLVKLYKLINNFVPIPDTMETVLQLYLIDLELNLHTFNQHNYLLI